MKYLQITSGRGPVECEIAVHNALARMIADRRVLLVETCQKASVIVAFDDKNWDYAKAWIGTIRWICPSPVRKNHKRKNWYIGVREVELPSDKPTTIMTSHLVWEFKGASSKGGQAANKGTAFVRLTHTPTGTSVIAEDERSQKQNKKVAVQRLFEALGRIKADAIAAIQAENWMQHNQLERGNPARTFEGPDFVER